MSAEITLPLNLASVPAGEYTLIQMCRLLMGKDHDLTTVDRIHIGKGLVDLQGCVRNGKRVRIESGLRTTIYVEDAIES